MVCFGVDLYRFSLICNDYFRKVVYKKEKGDEQIVLTPSISESNLIQFPQTRTLTGLSYTPNCGCKGTAFFGICKYSLYFFTLKVHLFMQGIDETNKSIPYIQRETYWCVF